MLRDAGLDPVVMVSDVDEDALLDELAAAPPDDVVVRLAQAKADAIVELISAPQPDNQSLRDAVLFTCDSMLLLDGRLTGKPHTADVAAAQWRQMRGRTAQLLTGHCVTRISGGAVVSAAHDTATTVISFAEIDDATIDAYVATGEPLGVAGAFTLDGLGGWFIDSIDGDPSSVIGIGLPTVHRLLRQVGVDVTTLWIPDHG